MCEFFSFCGDGYGNYRYESWSSRKALLVNSEDSPDSHTFILRGVPVYLQDRWSKYEYNPLLGRFRVDEGVEGHNHEAAEKWVRSLNFKDIVPALVVKPIVNPLKVSRHKVTKKDIQDLHQWASVGASVGDSVGDSVWASVWASVGASVWASVWAYCSSFFDIKFEYDFSCLTRLWERGFVPSFDGTTWRLHQGEEAKIVYEERIAK